MVETAAVNELGKALNCSIVTNNHQIVETLMQKVGLPLSTVNGGSNSVHMAIRHGSWQALSICFQHRPQVVEIIDIDENTILHMAIICGKWPVSGPIMIVRV